MLNWSQKRKEQEMRTIEIDNEVFEYLQKKAISFVETKPNDTLRRIFGLDKSTTSSNFEVTQNIRKKMRKTNLLELIKANILMQDQILNLHDYHGTIIEGFTATIDNNSLLWNNQKYSMSELAKIFLKQQGYESNSVRGPERWYTSDGVSIKTLWQKYLENMKE